MRTAAQERAIEAAYADTMACAARAWMKRAQEAEKMIGLLVYAAGGRVEITPRHYMDARHLVVNRLSNRPNASTVFETEVR